MSTGVLPASFRDPAGFLWTEDGVLYRQVNEGYGPHYDHLMSSGLYSALVERGLLVPHEETSLQGLRPGAYKVLRPVPVDFVSYPYEWCPGQLRDAAITTLGIQKLALDFGMSLRDASAYNVQLHRGRWALIDTLSFERYEEGRPWVAYRQFCQHFLAPLALMSYRDVRLGGLLRQHIDGIPLDLAAALLPRRTRLRPSLFLHVHAHARMISRYSRRSVPERARSRGMRLQALRGLVAGLERAVRKLRWDPPSSDWRDYYEQAGHYSDAAGDHKRQVVSKLVQEAAPRKVWDLGGNVGDFARLAAGHGPYVVCFDVDPACVEVNYRRTLEAGESSILPLVCDLANPSPALGWSHTERMSLLQRGPADLVLALALVHHLAVGNNVPFDRLAEFLAGLGPRLVIEFVPKEDEKVQAMLASREDVFPGYTAEGFEKTFGEWFEIERKEPIVDSKRSVYLMRRRTK